MTNKNYKMNKTTIKMTKPPNKMTKNETEIAKLNSLVRTMTELESVVFKLLLCFQSRLHEEPHRFLRAALLRSAAARGGRLDLPAHNRVRADVRLRIPAGVAR